MDFIGIGGGRSGTGWIYAGLYEHPQLCLPIKEIHFFSRPRYKEKGIEWYENIFKDCPSETLKGEYSVSYLHSEEATKRIHKHYPNVKLIVSLRNPIDRAFSNYKNEMLAGNISKTISFEEAIKEHPEYIKYGFYTEHLERYFQSFPRENILVTIFDDIKREPKAHIQRIYRFLEVDDSFVPPLLEKKVGHSRTQKFLWVNRIIRWAANTLRSRGLHGLVWVVRKTGIPEFVRTLNTERKQRVLSDATRVRLQGVYRSDVAKLSEMLDRDLLSEWFQE